MVMMQMRERNPSFEVTMKVFLLEHPKPWKLPLLPAPHSHGRLHCTWAGFSEPVSQERPWEGKGIPETMWSDDKGPADPGQGPESTGLGEHSLTLNELGT